jgi:hypothetical protein
MGDFQRALSAKIGQLAVRQNNVVGMLFQLVEDFGSGFDPGHVTRDAIIVEETPDELRILLGILDVENIQCLLHTRATWGNTKVLTTSLEVTSNLLNILLFIPEANGNLIF